MPSVSSGQKYPHGAPCKGVNCTDPAEHSVECLAEHAATVAGGLFLPAANPAEFSVKSGDVYLQMYGNKPVGLYSHIDKSAAHGKYFKIPNYDNR